MSSAPALGHARHVRYDSNSSDDDARGPASARAVLPDHHHHVDVDPDNDDHSDVAAGAFTPLSDSDDGA